MYLEQVFFIKELFSAQFCIKFRGKGMDFPVKCSDQQEEFAGGTYLLQQLSELPAFGIS